MKRLIFAFAISCAGAAPEETPPGPLAPQSEVESGPEELLPAEPEIEEFWQRFWPEQPDPDRVYPIDPHAFRGPRPSPFDGEQEQVEKGAISVLQGWSVNGHLAFQDGVNEVFPPGGGATYQDFCSGTANRQCDFQWHVQANDLSVESVSDFMNDSPQICGVQFAWFPCVWPLLTRASGGHALTFSIDLSDCPNDTTGRTLLRNGIRQALGTRPTVGGGVATSNMWQGSGVNWAEVSPSAGGGTVNFKCDPSGGVLAGNFQAYFTPKGPLTPFAAPGLRGLSVGVIGSCEEWEGTPVPRPQPYLSQFDTMYTYSKAQIGINWAGLFSSASCSSNAVNVERYIRNVMIHELGHYFGFQHTHLYWKAPYHVMNGGIGCAEMATSNQGFHPNLREAIFDLDMRIGAGLTVYDKDISCSGPGDGSITL